MKLAALVLLAFGLSVVGVARSASMAESLKDLDDETRASVLKELSKMKRFPNGDKRRQDPLAAQNGEGEDDSACNMNVGSPQPSRGGIRHVTTVVVGSVVQLCR